MIISDIWKCSFGEFTQVKRLKEIQRKASEEEIEAMSERK
jgi:hypothetical protein